MTKFFRRPSDLTGRDIKVYASLVDYLHADVGSIAGSTVGILVLTWISQQYDDGHYFGTTMLLLALVGFLRLAGVLHYRKSIVSQPKTLAVLRRWELLYGLGAVAFALLLGIFAAMVFLDRAAADLRIITAAAVVGYCGGFAGRNAGRPSLAVAQIFSAVLPLVAALVWSMEPLSLGLAVLLIIYSSNLVKIVKSLRNILIKAFQTERDVGEVNVRLDTAITHMMSGLCMIDADSRIQILNERFCTLLDLPQIQYQSLHELLVAALPRGSLRHSEISQIQKSLNSGDDLVLKFATDSGNVLVLKTSPTPAGGQVLTIDDVTEQTKAAADVERLAKFDPLTGLANRATIMTRLSEALSETTKATCKVSEMTRCTALMMIDLDKFKEVNDSLGHDAGDQLLVKVAERICAVVPESAMVGRLGGDEFVVVVDDISIKETEALAGRLVKALSKTVRVDAHLCQVTASVGIAMGPCQAGDVASLMKAADIALYARKGKGKNGFDLFDTKMAEALHKRRKLELDLAQAIKNETIDLAYQPIVSSKDRSIVSFEALARWNHPEFGPVPPDVFIPIAESTGMIVDLGRLVLTAACRQAMEWPDHIKVSVNVSPIQFKNRDALFTDIWLALSVSGLPARRLDLEVTESVLIDDATGMLLLIEMLRNMDISVSLDDFGTGYSSLAYVQNYQFDKIKLDKAFARSIETDRTSRATISALANIAQATGSTLLLEGVETEEQAKIAAAHGVHEMQGYLFSRPVPAAETLIKIAEKIEKKRVA
ncbi:MAG: putative bifunctional diguanylate cyclase/phosphodiesterase [Beijerinckiaceae bacterium]